MLATLTGCGSLTVGKLSRTGELSHPFKPVDISELAANIPPEMELYVHSGVASLSGDSTINESNDTQAALLNQLAGIESIASAMDNSYLSGAIKAVRAGIEKDRAKDLTISYTRAPVSPAQSATRLARCTISSTISKTSCGSSTAGPSTRCTST